MPDTDTLTDQAPIPRHIAVIMDGNGRWAKRHGKARIQGHDAGARSVRRVIEGCREMGVPALTLYAFSTENWRRSKTEVSALFQMMSKYIHKEVDALDENGVRIRFIGRLDALPARTLKDMRYCEEKTAHNTALVVYVAVNYGGRAEIVDAAKAIAAEAANGALDLDTLDEDAFARHLYAPEASEVDLLIRTSGELRISNFMLWQLSYAEFHITDTLWPDFGKEELKEAIGTFQKRSRRFGARP